MDDDATRRDSAENQAGPEPGEAISMLVAGWMVFGRYTLEKLVGRGGIGVVWRAQDAMLDEPVGLKFLIDVVARDRVAVDDLRQETMRARRLVHANIARINDFMRDHRFATVSMEYVDGQTLGQLRMAQAGGVFSVTALAPLVGPLCLALDYGHQIANIVHGDLKPTKILVTPEGVIKIIDFGISRSLREARIRLGGETARASESVVYLSPQQLDGGRPAATDDLYAFGAVLYELLTGKPPFYAGDIASQIRTAEPPLMAARRAELEVEGEPIPPEWEKIATACLAKDPAHRPSSGGEIARMLGLVGERPAAKGRPPADAFPLAIEPVQRSSGGSKSSQSRAPIGSKPGFAKPLQDHGLIQTMATTPEEPVPADAPAPPAVVSAPEVPSAESVPADVPAPSAVVSAPEVPNSEPIIPANPVPMEMPEAVVAPVPPAAPVPEVAPAPPAVVSAPEVPSAEPVPADVPAPPAIVSALEVSPSEPVIQARPVPPEMPEAVVAPVPPAAPVPEVAPAPPAIVSALEVSPSEPVIQARPVPPETPEAVIAPVPPAEPVPEVVPAPSAVVSAPEVPTSKPVPSETPEAVVAPVLRAEPVPAVAPAPPAVVSAPEVSSEEPVIRAKPVPPEAPEAVVPPVPPAEPVPDVGPAPPAVVNAPAAQPERPRPPRKRSVIHYATREEIDREVEEDEKAAQSAAGGGQKGRSWLSRAWKEFLRP